MRGWIRIIEARGAVTSDCRYVCLPTNWRRQRSVAPVNNISTRRTDYREQRYDDEKFAHLVEVGFGLRKHFLDARYVTSDVQAVHQ